jgi:prepilin-type N-terminal cleavage/methylation domain-containing protein
MKIKNIIQINNKNNKGLTLIEMMVVVVIISFLVIGLVTFFSGGIRAWIAGNNQLEAQRNARQAIDYMVKEIRKADKVEFGSDGDTIKVHIPPFDSDPVQTAYSVTYELADPYLRRIKGGGFNDIIDNVWRLVFTYYDINGNEITSITSSDNSVTRVRIQLEVDVDQDAAIGGNADIILNTKVDFRNYGYIGSEI